MPSKILAIILLSVFLMQLVLPGFIFEIERAQCFSAFLNSKYKSEVTNVELLIFPIENNLDWVEVGKEFMLNGKLYDVVSMIQNDTEIMIKVVADEHEDYLIASNYSDSYGFNKWITLKEIQRKIKRINYLPVLPLVNLKMRETDNQAFCTKDRLPHETFMEIISPPPDELLLKFNT